MKSIISWEIKKYKDSASLVLKMDGEGYDFGLLDEDDIDNVYFGLDSLRLQLFDIKKEILDNRRRTKK